MFSSLWAYLRRMTTESMLAGANDFLGQIGDGQEGVAPALETLQARLGLPAPKAEPESVPAGHRNGRRKD